MSHPGIRDIIDHDLCIACGACVEACPHDSVSTRYHAGRGAPEAHIDDAAACHGCPAPCDDVCPSIEVDLAGLLGATSPVPRVGPIERVWIGHAPVHRDDGVSSSGGVLRALVTDAIDRGVPVVAIGREAEGYVPQVHRTHADLQRVPGSIYHSLSFAPAIELLRTLDQPALLVAIPCHLAGLRAYASQHEPALLDKIAFTAGIICGWMFTDHALRAFTHYHGVPGAIVDARYRGEDKVGRLKIETTATSGSWNRRTFATDAERIHYRASFARYANRLRCRLCEDHLNVLADVAVGDAWLARTRGQKTSVVVARTASGLERIDALVAAGRLVLQPGTVDDLYESQSADLVEGRTARRLGAVLAAAGRPVPRFRYRDGRAAPAPTLRARADVAFEDAMRALMRTGSYGAYRAAYAGRDTLIRAKDAMHRRRGGS